MEPLHGGNAHHDDEGQDGELGDLERGSDCVGAIAWRAGTFRKSWTIKTKTFR